jgi:hypothetical protein
VWCRIATQALRESIPVRLVEYGGWVDVDDTGRLFGGDTSRFKEVDGQGNA